jgi:hypothetical protein
VKPYRLQQIRLIASLPEKTRPRKNHERLFNARKALVRVRIEYMTDAEVLEAPLIELSVVGNRSLCLHAARHVVYIETTRQRRSLRQQFGFRTVMRGPIPRTSGLPPASV